MAGDTFGTINLSEAPSTLTYADGGAVGGSFGRWLGLVLVEEAVVGVVARARVRAGASSGCARAWRRAIAWAVIERLVA